MTARKPLTHAEIARHASALAAKAARWSGDFLTLPDDAGLPVDPGTAARFTAEIRRHLDSLDARLAATTPVPGDARDASEAGSGHGR